MAIVTEMPSMNIIDGFKKTIDFYVWKGLSCARKWPKSPGRVRSPAVMAQWQAWRTAAAEWSELSPAVQEAFNALSTNSGLSGRDMQVRAYITGLYRYPLP